MLYAHQQAGAQMLADNKRYALWWEMGTGKTATVLTAIGKLNFPGMRALVLCPLAIIESAWRRDAETFAPSVWFQSCRQRDWDSTAPGIHAANYEMFRSKFAKFSNLNWDVLVVDESSKLKDFRSQTSKRVRQLAANVGRVILLSGTPAPNDALEYWPQLFCINPKVLGDSYYSFRYRYGKAERIYAPGARQVDKWTADPKRLPDMLAKIATVSHTLTKQECVDLPDKVDEVIYVDLQFGERTAYEKMRDDLVLRFGGGQYDLALAVNAMAEVMKLRQLANGWTYGLDRKAHVVGTSKLDALDELLDGIGNKQAIIWIEFREDAQRIHNLLGDKATFLVGGLSESDRQTAIRSFTGGEKQYLVAHPASAGHGLTFVNCHYAIFYGLGYSYELHQQARDRIHRIGQINKCTYLYLLSRDTIDENILKVVRGKQSACAATLEILQRERVGTCNTSDALSDKLA